MALTRRAKHRQSPVRARVLFKLRTVMVIESVPRRVFAEQRGLLFESPVYARTWEGDKGSHGEGHRRMEILLSGAAFIVWLELSSRISLRRVRKKKVLSSQTHEMFFVRRHRGRMEITPRLRIFYFYSWATIFITVIGNLVIHKCGESTDFFLVEKHWPTISLKLFAAYSIFASDFPIGRSFFSFYITAQLSRSFRY